LQTALMQTDNDYSSSMCSDCARARTTHFLFIGQAADTTSN
jgi:hypothetical protein